MTLITIFALFKKKGDMISLAAYRKVDLSWLGLCDGPICDASVWIVQGVSYPDLEIAQPLKFEGVDNNTADAIARQEVNSPPSRRGSIGCISTIKSPVHSNEFICVTSCKEMGYK